MIAAAAFQVKPLLLNRPLTNRCIRFWHGGMCFEFYLHENKFSNYKN